MKDNSFFKASFQRISPKTLMQTDFWEDYASALGKDIFLSFGMLPFMGSNYISKKRLIFKKFIKQFL